MEDAPEGAAINRRDWLQQSSVQLLAAATATTTTMTTATPAWAASRPPLADLLYTILRVREATEQESRLIKSGKFKDVQRANVKLAVRFMVENYRLADAFVAAAAYLDGNDRRIAAGDVGQAAVQNLVTILEYFDSSDVQNLKVGVCAVAWLCFVWCLDFVFVFVLIHVHLTQLGCQMRFVSSHFFVFVSTPVSSHNNNNTGW